MFTHHRIIPSLHTRQWYLMDTMVLLAVILAMISLLMRWWYVLPSADLTHITPELPFVWSIDQITASSSDITTGQDLFVPASQIKNLIKLNTDMSQVHQQIRRSIIRQLIANKYQSRASKPYLSNANNLITLNTGAVWYTIHREISNADPLDLYIRQQLTQYDSISSKIVTITKPIIIPHKLRSQWSDVYLFKNQWDLESLGYEIVSSRTRINQDKDYRRFNIMTAFAKMGNVLVVNPWQELSYLRDIDFDNGPRINYKFWLSIIGDEEISDYGWGICGSSTAVYQGILTNTALDITKSRAHSRRYSDLYPAVINGDLITTPWLDSALYGPALDLHFTNIRDYPVIIIANYDGTLGGVEQVFSFGRREDHGSFEFVSSYKTSTIDTINGSTLRWWCYTWMINGEKRTSCYKKVS